MKIICLVIAVSALSAGCSVTPLTAEEQALQAAYADGYAPTGTAIKRNNVNRESNLIVMDKTALENAKNGVAPTHGESKL
ncbi:MAG: hypothetical protein V4723_20525 [Pseudomonadota bacterium]